MEEATGVTFGQTVPGIVQLTSSVSALLTQEHPEQPPPSSSTTLPTLPIMPVSFPYELVDKIVRVAVALRRHFVLRKHILNGKLRRAIQREFFAGVCPGWKLTSPRWNYFGKHVRRRGESYEGDDEIDMDLWEEEMRLNCDLRRFPPDPVAIGQIRWVAFRFLVDAGFSTKGHENMATAYAIDEAVATGRVPLVRLLHAQGLPNPSKSAIVEAIAMELGDFAAGRGKFEVVEFLHKTRRRNLFYTSPWTSPHANRSKLSDSFTSLARRAAPGTRWISPQQMGSSTLCAFSTSTAGWAALPSRRMKPQEVGTLLSSDTFTSIARRVAPPRPWMPPSRLGPCLKSRAKVSPKDVAMFSHEARSEGCTTRAMDSTIRLGHFHIVDFLHKNRHEGCSSKGIDDACISWAMSIAPKPWQRKASPDAGQKECELALFLLRNRPERCTVVAAQDACEGGCVELLRILLDTHPELCYRNLLKMAFKKCNVEILRVLYEAGKRFTEEEVEPPLDPDSLLRKCVKLQHTCAKCTGSHR
ncbi:hypothetical protein BDK51DRAFT_49812 [Blyttiomyces helicus]|uniref:Ankyrin repeat-containing domain protein n=1 Tax=Blyttiomyces helicus TaxID=388810 RepID=A0A4P9WFK0_9FUNG|nr:hypothetical protein BDK51DRAFT_49812 [Blyttiomyces helicus]|eukprot:RKO91404.1 hypothetical protein BDK51DRAFT_49812 [Blyttiomyces helicus]